MSLRHAERSPGSIHPDLWRAAELAGNQHLCHASGHPALDAELPGAGWPTGALIELLHAQPGMGELRLLEPALARLEAGRPIVLLQPPYAPNSLCCTPAASALDPACTSATAPGAPSSRRSWLWIAPERAIDAPWAAEQVLKNGSCAALLYWQTDIRAATLRRLHLAAQSSDMLFFMFRPARAAAQASPAPLRIQLMPAPAGLHIDILKRRGPALNETLLIDLPTPAPNVHPHLTPNAPLDRRTPSSARAGRVTPALHI